MPNISENTGIESQNCTAIWPKLYDRR